MSQEPTLDIFDKLSQLKFDPENKDDPIVLLQLNLLQDNLQLIRQNEWDLSILKFIRDMNILLYDTALNYEASLHQMLQLDMQHDIYGDVYDNPINYHDKALLETQLAKLLINLKLHKLSIYKLYNKIVMQSLATTLKYYTMGSYCGFSREAWNTFCVLIIGTLLLILFISLFAWANRD